MTTLSLHESGELRLTLRGAAENQILATVRRWPHWHRVDIERDPADGQRCLSVTLVADVTYEPTMREILKRSFDLNFPTEGGSIEFIAKEPVSSGRRRK